jgi:hypothetical protein
LRGFAALLQDAETAGIDLPMFKVNRPWDGLLQPANTPILGL